MRRILIIEDNTSLIEEISDWFIFEGFETFLALSGKEGVDLANKHIPDLIICDIMMPETDGYEVLTTLQQNPVTRFIPFILMTALTEREKYREGMVLGADDFITKPFTKDEMLSAVYSRLKKSDEAKEQAELALNDLRNNIISNLPHELRTPVNGILGFSQLLMDDSDCFSKEEISEFGKNINYSAQRLNRLIKNYLIYAQLETRVIDNSNTIILNSPDKICEKVTMEVAEKYGRKNDLNLHIDNGVIYLLGLEFSKIVEELTDNAFKFSSPGKKVEVSCGMEKDKFCLRVKDQGKGIASENIRKIGAYMQFDRKLKEQQGSGLGLIITKRLVELYDGKMTIESIPGIGSTFEVMFPAN